MKNKLFLALGFLAIAFTSCDDYLTREPYSKIDSEKFFANEDELKIYANGLYVTFMPTAAGLSLGNT
ncbi:MAG: RagB/SusD family nutrient uptake outer membrane protein, partial [Hallella bergensis]